MAPGRNFRLTGEEKAAIDDFYRREAPRLAAALRDLPWAGGSERREALAAVAEAQRRSHGALTKDAFDAILKWGFGRASKLPEADIEAATREAFEMIAGGDQAGAVRRLQALPGVGVSRTTKILALSDQKNLGIYDSHAAASLSAIRSADGPLIRVPPGVSNRLKSTPPATQKRLADNYPKYTAILRRLLENAEKDPKHGRAFKRVADVERALFSASRSASEAAPTHGPGPAAASTALKGWRSVGGAAIAGAAPGAVADSAALARGELDAREFAKRRLKDGGLAALASGAAKGASRFGKATSGVRAHAQAGARSAGVAVVVTAAAELPALARGEMQPRDFIENRTLDALEAGGSKVAGGAVVLAVAAAPFEAPAVAVGVAVVGIGIGATYAVRPVRRRVVRAQIARAERRRSVRSDDHSSD